MNKKEPQTVSEMTYEPGVWDLSELVPQGIEKAKQEIEAKTKAFEAWKPKLKPDIPAETVVKISDELCALRTLSSKLSHLVELEFSAETADPKISADSAHVGMFLTDIGNRLIFFSHWFKKLPENEAKRIIAGAGKHARVFELIWKNRQYSLDEEQEKIVSIKDSNGIDALQKVYSVMTSAYKYPLRGKLMTRDELTNCYKSGDASLRKEAYAVLLDTFKKDKDVLGEIYRAVAMDWFQENVNLRKFNGTMQARNVRNDLPDNVVDALLKATEKNWQVFHRYFEVKRRKLGLDKMRRHDVYAAIGGDEKMSYPDAVKTVLRTFSAFSPDFAAKAQRVLDEKHVHAILKPNKTTGAFCATVSPEVTPYVLMNYAGTLDNASTLAHELGHAVHSLLASKHTIMTQHAGIPLAETASIFAETLMVEELIKDPKREEALLFGRLDDAYASIIRQVSFVLFERKAHEMLRQGKSTQELENAYLELLKQNVGPNVEVDDSFRYEWYAIPHIYNTPFYCYGYAFGNLMAFAFYEKFRKEGAKAVPQILAFFEAGGSEAPIEIAKRVGVDITSEKFWQQGFDFIKSMVERAEKLA